MKSSSHQLQICHGREQGRLVLLDRRREVRQHPDGLIPLRQRLVLQQLRQVLQEQLVGLGRSRPSLGQTLELGGDGGLNEARDEEFGVTDKLEKST